MLISNMLTALHAAQLKAVKSDRMHLLLASTDEFMGEIYIAAPGKSSRVQQLMCGRKRATDGAERGASDTRVTQMKQMWCVSASYRCTPPLEGLTCSGRAAAG